jgi:tmRNA-binding protein
MALLSPYVAFLFNFRALLPPTRHFAVRAAVDAAVNRTSAPRPDAVEYTWDAGLSLLPLEVKALRSKLCDLTASAVTCPSPSRAALTGVSFPGWAASANAFGLAHGPSTVGPGGAKRELPLLLKRQQMRKLFASASSAALELHCIKIYFSETGWAKARIVAARKPLPPDHRRVSAERELRRRDIQDD